MQQVDRLLAAGAGLFPDEAPAERVEPVAAPTSAPQGTSGLAAAARQAGARYREIDSKIAELTASLDEAVKRAAAQAIQAGIEAKTIRVTASSQADAIDEATDGADGLGALVTTMDERLGAMADHITSTREQLRATAMQIRQLSAQLSAAARPNGPG